MITDHLMPTVLRGVHLLALLVATLCAIPVCAEAGETLSMTRNAQLETQYFALSLVEYGFDAATIKRLSTGAVGGGAFTPVLDKIAYIAANGRSFLVDLDQLRATPDFLPPLDLGAAAFARQHRLTAYETWPRVHDLVLIGSLFYVTYDFFKEDDQSIHFQMASIKQGDAKWNIILQSRGLNADHYTLESGGAMQVDGSKLYFSVGDYSLDEPGTVTGVGAQDANGPWGKVEVMDLASEKVSMFTLGHRNVQGLALLRDGRLLASEQGPRGGDKLNVLVQGKNYGWPDTSSGSRYGSYAPIGGRHPQTAFEPALFEFTPSIAPTQLIQLEGFDRDWDDDLLLATLKAQTLFRVRLAPNRVLSVEPVWIGERIRALKQAGKKIFLLTDNATFITLSLGSSARDAGDLMPSQALHTCSACHGFVAAESNRYAPNLANVLGRQIGSTSFANYSPALRLAGANGSVWDRARLTQFLRDPRSFIVGTTMPSMHLTDKEVDDAVNALSQIQSH